jgi:hypothetical protein
MAHAFGTSGARQSLATNPNSYSYTTPAGATCMALMIVYAGAVDRAGGAPSFAGFTMSWNGATVRAAVSPETTVEMWWIEGQNFNLSAVTGNVVIPNTGALTIRSVVATGIAGGGFTSARDDYDTNTATSTNPTVTSTPTINGDIIFAVVGSGATTWAPSAQSGTNIVNTDAGANGDGMQYALRALSGAFAMSWTFGTSDDWAAIAVAFKEVTPPPPAEIRHHKAVYSQAVARASRW